MLTLHIDLLGVRVFNGPGANFIYCIDIVSLYDNVFGTKTGKKY
jgi:hypothetical protein